MKKRAVALLLVTMMLISLFPAAAFGAGETASQELVLPSKTEYKTGETFDVTLRMTSSAGLSAYDGNITYDSSRLEVVGEPVFKAPNAAMEAMMVSDSSAGFISTGSMAMKDTDAAATTDIIKVTFRVKSGAPKGDAIIKIDTDNAKYAMAFNLEGVAITGKVQEGKITVANGTAAPAPAPDPIEPTPEPAVLTKEQRNAGTVGLQIGNYAAVKEGGLTWIDRDNKNVVPYIKNRRTMVPLRYISESLGADVFWDNDTRTATVKKGDKVIQVPIGADHYLVNGVKYTQDAPAEIVERRTFVPIRCIAEALACDVEWENTNRLVIIAPIAAPWDLNGETEQIVMNDWLLVMSPLLRDFV